MSIHGITPEASEEQSTHADVKLSDNQKEAMKIARQRAIERKKMEFKNKRG